MINDDLYKKRQDYESYRDQRPTIRKNSSDVDWGSIVVKIVIVVIIGCSMNFKPPTCSLTKFGGIKALECSQYAPSAFKIPCLNDSTVA